MRRSPLLNEQPKQVPTSMTTVVPRSRHRLSRGRRGGRPVRFDAEKYKGRNVTERSFGTLKQWRALATRYDRSALTYRAGVLLSAVRTWVEHLAG